MDHHQREMRRAAARAFMESLDHLQQTFHQPAEGQSAPGTRSIPDKPVPPKPTASSDLQAFEQAAADIEDFFNQSRA